MQTSDRHTELVEKVIYESKLIQKPATIVGLKCIYFSLFDKQHYEQVSIRIRGKMIDSLQNLKSPEKSDFNEYLEIYSFSDQNNKQYLATIYDSDELWQDPQIIDILDQ